MITARCPSCSYEYRIPPTFVGKKIKCKQESCGQVFKVAKEDIKPAEVIPESEFDEPQPAAETYQVESGYLEQDSQEFETTRFGKDRSSRNNSKYDSIIPDEVRECFTEDEGVLFAGRISPLVLKFQLVLSALPFVFFLLVLLVSAFIGNDPSWTIVVSEALGLVIGYLIIAFVVWLVWTNNVYIITDYRIIVRMGVFDRAIRVIPTKHIQSVTINTGFIARLLSLSSIQFTTAASSAGLPIPFFSQWFRSDGNITFNYIDSKKVMKAYGISDYSPGNQN